MKLTRRYHQSDGKTAIDTDGSSDEAHHATEGAVGNDHSKSKMTNVSRDSPMTDLRAEAERIVNSYVSILPAWDRLVDDVAAALAAAESRGAQRALREAAEAAERFAQEFPEMPFAQYVSANALRARAEALSSAQQGQ